MGRAQGGLAVDKARVFKTERAGRCSARPSLGLGRPRGRQARSAGEGRSRDRLRNFSKGQTPIRLLFKPLLSLSFFFLK